MSTEQYEHDLITLRAIFQTLFAIFILSNLKCPCAIYSQRKKIKYELVDLKKM